MAGNVWEWTLDKYTNNYYQTLKDSPQQPVVDPMNEDGSSDLRVLRGGGFGYFFARYLRVSIRFVGVPSFAHFNLGFRCARSIP